MRTLMKASHWEGGQQNILQYMNNANIVVSNECIAPNYDT